MSEDWREVMGAEGKGGLGCIGPAGGGGGGRRRGEREKHRGRGGEGVRAEWGVMGLGSGGFLFGTK